MFILHILHNMTDDQHTFPGDVYKYKDHSVVYIDSALIPEDTRAQNDKSVGKYKPRQYILRQR